MSDSDQTGIGAKPDLLYNILDLQLDLGARMDIFHLPSETKKTNLEYQTQLTPWD